MNIYNILPATAIDRAYSYKSEQPLAVGTYVQISFGRQDVLGVVWEGDVDTSLPINKVKKISEIYDAPALSADMIAYIERVASWTMSAKGMILKMVCPSFKLLEPPKRPLKFQCTSIDGGGAVTLSEDQGKAAHDLRSRIGQGYNCTLLDGVTGAGKTEVYFEAVAECLRAGQQALIMMPEIALTGGFVIGLKNELGRARPCGIHK
jgi:primosomal protein N' (replication factor Y)